MITILGWIFLAIIIIWLISHIIIYFVNLFTDDKYRGFTIDTYGWITNIDGWYIIPSMSIDVGRYIKYTEICFRWLCFTYCIHISPTTKEDDDLLAEVRREKNKKKNEK